MSEISIHALLAESDSNESGEDTNNRNFYPRSPCGERPLTLIIGFLERVFLSTLSLRRATCGLRVGLPVAGHFYPRSPCGERLLEQLSDPMKLTISIHALLAESD